MNHRNTIGIALMAWLIGGAVEGFAADAQLQLRQEGTNLFIEVQGDPGDEWRFQTSTSLALWTNTPAFGTVFSGETNPPSLSAGAATAVQHFYRAVKTIGLYDVAVLRTLSLTFAQSNWQSILAANYSTGSNLAANLAFEGTNYSGVGVHYKGNTSYTRSGVKKSLNLTIDYTYPTQRLRGFETLNLNNGFSDESMMREPLYFNVMHEYTVGPRASFVKLFINGEYWGIYSFAQQENGDLLKEYFESNDGDRWKAPSGTGSGGSGFAPAAFASGDRALKWLGTNETTYRSRYELKTTNSANPWPRLIHAIDVLNNASTNGLRDQLEDVLAVHRWLWFLAIENVFTDDDSYWNKGADYEIYYEPETGRLHPIEHDGNEAFMTVDTQLSPMHQFGNTNRPVITRLLAVSELKQRYLAHMRTVLQEWFNPSVLNPLVDQHRDLILADFVTDTKKGYTMQVFSNDLAAVRTFVQQRSAWLTTNAELRPLPPIIASVSSPLPPQPNEVPVITAEVRADGTNGVNSVWLYYRPGPIGRFSYVPMLDDGAHGDGPAEDGIFGASMTNFPAGTKVRYYVEARSANSARAASFAPARAEEVTFSYRVTNSPAGSTPVVINEIMASNSSMLADPQGEFDDWIELHNVTDQEVDLSGWYLSDEPANPRKWVFPPGTTIPSSGFLLVWADEDGTATPGLHASFKLSGSGEEIFLSETDPNLNVLLDSVAFGPQTTDRSYGRAAAEPNRFEIMDPTPGQPNF
jgi:hypothetical protein